jgi:tetratricopeptide (TPR) repeat protein
VIGSRGNLHLPGPADQNTPRNKKIDRIDRLCFVQISALAFSLFFSCTAIAQVLDQNSLTSPSPTVSVQQLNISSKVYAHLLRAQKQFSKKNLQNASAEVDRALLDDPQCAVALAMRAFIRLATKDFSGAVADAVQATALDPRNAQAFLALATAYNSQGNMEAATAAAEEALQLVPSLWQARLEIAKALYKQSKFAAALHELALLNIDFPDIHLVRGDALMMLGRQTEGADEFIAFLRQAPADPRSEPIRQILAGLGRLADLPTPIQR